MIETSAQQSLQTQPSESKQQRLVRRAIRRKSFATLATVSPTGKAHVAGVIYSALDDELWVHTMLSSHKVRNIANNPSIGVCIVYRRLPVGPPFTIHFQAKASIVEIDSIQAKDRIATGKLKSITGHGALEIEGACFLQIRPGSSIHSFGPGVPTLDLIKDPIGSGGRSVRM